MNKEKSKKYRLKKDEYIKELELKNKKLILINQLLINKMNAVKNMLNYPIVITSNWESEGSIDGMIIKELGEEHVKQFGAKAEKENG